MWHATCMQVNWVDSRFLMVGSQTVNLTPDPSFEHNLCFRCPNGSCEPISHIYSFPMSFDPCNRSLRIRKSTRTPTPKVGVPLRMWGFIPSHSFTFPRAWNVTPRFPSWPTLLQALCLGREPKARVATLPYFLLLLLHLFQLLLSFMEFLIQLSLNKHELCIIFLPFLLVSFKLHGINLMFNMLSLI